MASRKSDLDKLPGTSFHIFLSSAVVKDDWSVGAFERKTGPFQPGFDLVLLADDDIQPRVSFSKPVQCSVLGKGWADKNNEIKHATEWAAQLFHKKLRLARVGQPNDKSIEWDIFWIHFNTVQIPTVY